MKTIYSWRPGPKYPRPDRKKLTALAEAAAKEEEEKAAAAEAEAEAKKLAEAPIELLTEILAELRKD